MILTASRNRFQQPGATLLTLAFLAVAIAPSVATAGSAPSCAGMVFETRAGSELDEGWSGKVHDVDFVAGARTSWKVLKRCSNDQSPCEASSDCGGNACTPTCDCNSDASCELAGPVDGRKCLTTFADCTTNADCPATVACVNLFGAPLPLSVDNTPFCIVTSFEGDASGAFDSTTGAASIRAALRQRTFVGIGSAQPCPRCGSPEQDPQIGDQFTCEGGQTPGAVCTVDGVTPVFGGTSSDCAPSNDANVTGNGIVIHLDDLTTAAVTRTAQLPCANISFKANPLSAGTNPKCTDDLAGAVCTSNSDCKRCSGDSSIKCSSNGDCAGNGTCAAAPDQPITCGYWCHCGFCNNNGSLPCFENSQCPEGQACIAGTGGATATNSPQQRPNGCTQDASICGTAESARCENTQVGFCSLQQYRTCTDNSDCENFAAGTCTLMDKSCFESRISLAGEASPVGSYCAFEDKTCGSNADCTSEPGDFCASDASRPRMVAAFCATATTSSPINTVEGLTGPGALSTENRVQICRCLPGEAGCSEVCGEVSEGCGDGIVQAGEDCDGEVCCNPDCTLASSSTVCRVSAGTCDVAELCSGSATGCPSDAFASSATVCRASSGVCDTPEVCTGAASACPVDAFRPSTTTCRDSGGDCDAAEACSGTAVACPTDASQPDGTACDDGNTCTTDECHEGSCEGTAIPGCGGECGNGVVDSGEACDDGNATFTPGEYCGVDCVLIPCGKPTNSSGELPKSSDALFALKAAVGGQGTCSPRVCSVDGNSTVLASDALRILRAAVGQDVTLTCPLA